MDEEWLKLQGEQEPEPAFVSVVQQVQVRPTVIMTRIAQKPVEVIPDSPLVIAARAYSQAEAFLERSTVNLETAQRVYDQAVESKQKAHEELKQAVTEIRGENHGI
jgi:hypothetical protein